jgi:hypothetical protein
LTVSRYDWSTPMRRVAGEPEARAADRLAGQAAAIVHPDGRVTLVCMPDAGCFPADATISADDADRFVQLIWAQRLAAIEQYKGTEASKIKEILRGTAAGEAKPDD